MAEDHGHVFQQAHEVGKKRHGIALAENYLHVVAAIRQRAIHVVARLAQGAHLGLGLELYCLVDNYFFSFHLANVQLYFVPSKEISYFCNDFISLFCFSFTSQYIHMYMHVL